MKFESILSFGRGRLSVWVTAGLAVLAVAAGGCRRHRESLAPSSPLQEADRKLLEGAQRGELALVREAIDAGANVNCRSTNGLTPMLQTMWEVTAPYASERRECIAFLLERGAAVDAPDRDGRPPLAYAARAGDLETVQWLVKTGATIKKRDGFHKTPMLYAAEGGHPDIVVYLGNTLKTRDKASVW